MIILPAIDLKDGHCVRLRQGRADDVTVYADDPVAQALDWRDQGAEQLHVVDLDGAFQGAPQHTAVISASCRRSAFRSRWAAVCAAMRMSSSFGGWRGACNYRHARVGKHRCPAALVQRFGDAIAVGIDARWLCAGRVVETTDTRATALARQVVEVGVRTIIYTDTATDGMRAAPT